MKRIKTIIATLLLAIVSAFCLVACDKNNDPDKLSCSVKESGETFVVISVDQADGDFLLLDCMSALQKEGKMTYEMQGTMVQSINGKANTANFSSCWMLYTTDSEFSTTEYGSYTWGGQEMGSAILGAEALPVLEGALYAWVYVTF